MRTLGMATLLFAASLAQASVAHAAQSETWRITKTEWTEADEKGFGDFVRTIAESGCSTTIDCLKDATNPYRDSDPKSLRFVADCADWPYMLRAYYAWHNGLPFSYVNGISGSASDMRFGSLGNRPASRRELVDHGGGIAALPVLAEIHMTVSSGTYRVDAAESGRMLSDFYSPKIEPGSIHAGTALYDINGHVALVYAVEDDGRIRYMDADPDHTVSRSVFGPQFGQSQALLGGGFKNFRPQKLVGATRTSDGRYVGGHIELTQNADIANFSLEQYRGSGPDASGDGTDALFQYKNEPVDLFQYVRGTMSGGTYVFDPVLELKAGMDSLCNQLKERGDYVDAAIKAGIDKKAHPDALPSNIYASEDEEWESYATPSRDARLKNAFALLYMDIMKMVFRKADSWPEQYAMQQTLQKTYAEKAQDCQVSYMNSAGQSVIFGFDDAVQRLFKISFDPYDCVERRWGATSDAELATCKEDETKQRWYDAEQHLRNQAERNAASNVHLTLDGLEKGVRGSGAEKPPPADLKFMIDNIGKQPLMASMSPVGF